MTWGPKGLHDCFNANIKFTFKCGPDVRKFYMEGNSGRSMLTKDWAALYKAIDRGDITMERLNFGKSVLLCGYGGVSN